MSQSPLTFDLLRQATRTRTPLFRNSHGEPVHHSGDGSCWSPATWLQALIGELGEYARVRHQYEAGEITHEVFAAAAAKELADIQCYLDLLAMRALDKAVPRGETPMDSAQELQLAIAGLGEYANWRKKYQRGDITYQEFLAVSSQGLEESVHTLQQLPLNASKFAAPVSEAHPTGVDLGDATRDKFNEVSTRVGVPVYIEGGEVRNGGTGTQ